MPGFFITFEGGEGAGKSTQITGLKNRLEDLGHSVLVTREPGGSPDAERIRAFILSGAAKPLGAFAETLLFAAARLDHLEKTIRPALARGQIVLCDRFADSTRAYQGASGNVDKTLIKNIERVVVGENRPQLTLVIDLPVEIGLARAGTRRAGQGAADRFEAEDRSFHEKLRQAYLDIAAAEPDRCVVIDGNQPVDRVEKAIWGAVETRLAGLAAPDAGNANKGLLAHGA